MAHFDLDGRDMRVTRQAVNRVKRAGATTLIRRHSALTDEEMQHIVDRADTWRDTETERGFSMALDRLGDPADGDCLLVEAFDDQGTLIALLSFVPWGKDGISLDLMRRDRAAPNGIMEFMVAQLCAAAPGLGVRRISLNFAVFRSAFEEGGRIGAGPVLKLWRRLLLFFSRWWQLEALYRSNVKYGPEWYPRFLCYQDAGSLARVSLASGIAEGFVSVPSMRKLWGKGHARGLTAPVTTEGLPSIDSLGLDLVADETAGAPAERLPEQVRVRHDKLERIRAAGTDPYPVGIPQRTHTVAQLKAAHPGHPPGARTGEEVTLAGRVMVVRDLGGVVFAVLRDWSGDTQLMLTRDEAGAGVLDSFTSQVDFGDHVLARGEVGASRSGELSLVVRSWQLTGKCLRPLPDKRKGLADPEARVRRRYLDLVASPEARDVVRARSAAVQALRQGLLDRGYLEVETPMLQQIHGGANARPFRTHINAYDLDLYLRIAPRAVPEAAVRRRHGEGLRDGPHLPQRGRLLQAQPRVHDAGGVPGLRRLRRDARPDARADPGRRHRRLRLAHRPQGRPGRQARRARHLRDLAGQDDVRGDRRGPRRGGRRRHRRTRAAPALRPGRRAARARGHPR
ncbi:hypothetical protein GCM10020254_16490 [Streptomyces goshikiensis]